MESFVIQRSALLFGGWQPNFQNLLHNLEVAASKFRIDLNGLKNGTSNNFENSLKSIQIFQILMGGKNLGRGSKNQMSSAVRKVGALKVD